MIINRIKQDHESHFVQMSNIQYSQRAVNKEGNQAPAQEGQLKELIIYNESYFYGNQREGT